jgi:hypothetical protein
MPWAIPDRRADPAVVERIIGTVGNRLHVQPGEITKVGGKYQITHKFC